MDSGAQAPGRAPSRWTSRSAVVAYVLLAGLVVVVSFWAARAGRADTGSGPTPTASGSPGGGGTPRITIALTPSWESQPQPAVTGTPELVAEPAGMADPVVLAGAATEGYARLDPSSGDWLWRRDTQSRPFLGWAGSTAVFGGPGGVNEDRTNRGWVVYGVTPDGRRVFTAHAGRYVASTPTRVLLVDGRSLTALTPGGQVAWRGRLPAGVTVPGRLAGPTGPDAVPGAPVEVAFVSSSGPGRVTTVDLVDGRLRTHAVDADEPEAWSTAWGVVVGDPEQGSVTRYDLAGERAWSEDGGLTLLAVEDDVALVSDPHAGTVELLRVEDGSTVFTSDPLEGDVAAGALTPSAAGPVLVSLSFTDAGSAPLVLAADLTSGDQLWGIERRHLLGTWHGYALFAATDSRALSALDLRTGISYATLNASTVVDPAGAAVVGSELIYLDPATGVAHAVALADRL